MTKSRYYIFPFPSYSVKSPLAILSGHVLRTVDRIFQTFEIYADESYEESPRRILHNMMQNNETIFGLGISGTTCASKSNLGQTCQESSSSLKEDSSFSCLKRKLSFKDKDSSSENLVTKTEDGKELVEPAEISSSSADEKMVIAKTKDADVETNPTDEREITESKEDINVLIIRNLVQISSMSIIRQIDSIGVEIYINLSCMTDRSYPETPEKDSSPTQKLNSPERRKRKKSKSPSCSPSKPIQSEDNLSTVDASIQTVDYSDRNILDFLADRLLSIFISRKTCMESICNCLKELLRDVRDFYNTIDNLTFVVENLPMANEPYVTSELLKLRGDLINEAHQMSGKSQSCLKGVERDVDVLEKCVNEIGIFEREYVPSLSTRSELTIDDLKKFELRLKEICKKADATVILKDGRRGVLLKCSSEFDWLVKNFVKFLIITGILKPHLTEHSQVDEDKISMPSS